MTTLNNFLLQMVLLVTFVSFSLSSAHLHLHKDQHKYEHAHAPKQAQAQAHASPRSPQAKAQATAQTKATAAMTKTKTTHATVDYRGCWSKLFAFGDSSTDTGNGYLMGGLKNYTSASFSKSYYASASGNLQGHRLTNGRLIVDHLTEALAVPTMTPYKSISVSKNFSGSVNFAIAGSSSLSRDYFYNNQIGHSFMWSRVPESYQTQIDWFNNYYMEGTRRRDRREFDSELANTLFWIGGVGSSDYVRMYGTSVTGRLLSDLSVSHVSKILRHLLSKGARYIIVQGLAPSGCLPSQLSMCPLTDRDRSGCSGITNAMIRIHNRFLQNRIKHFRRRYPDSIIVYADAYGAYTTILENYKSYHIKEPFKACCGSQGDGAYNFDVHCLCGSTGSTTCSQSSEYINWDGIHLTDSMNGHLTDLFLNKGYCEPSFDQLVRKKKGM